MKWLLYLFGERKPVLDAGSHNFGLKPTMQKMSGIGPDGNLIGDCFPACLASVLHLDLEAIPLFSLRSLREQLIEANQWLIPRGITLRLFPADHNPPRDQYYMVRGASPRYKGYYHMVIGRNGKIAHDPHPDGRGIVGEPTHYLYFKRLVD